MDKYEFKLKVDEMKALASARNYNAAAEIAQTINWRKIRNLNALVLAGEIYEQAGFYEKSKDVLLMAYDKSPIGRNIIYRLAEIAIKTRNFEDAGAYYDEFVEIAPHDNLKFVLKYKMTAAQGLPYAEQIKILEDLKEQEYSEEWAYELAYLYHRNGQVEKCVEACDELILWFGDGIYVEKALELKMHYQPLTRQQEEKYRLFRQKRAGIIEVKPDDFYESGGMEDETVETLSAEAGAEKFNTKNLQQEIAKGMQQVIRQEEHQTLLDAVQQKTADLQNYRAGVPETAYDQSYGTGMQETAYQQNYGAGVQEALPQPQPEWSMDEILADWEKTKKAAQTVLHEAKEHELETEKKQAFQGAQQLMERLTEIVPQLTAGVMPKELLENGYLQETGLLEHQEQIQDDIERAGRIVAGMNQLLQEQIDRLILEGAQTQAADVHKVADPTRELPELPEEVKLAAETVADAENAAAVDIHKLEEQLTRTADMEMQVSAERQEPVSDTAAQRSGNGITARQNIIRIENEGVPAETGQAGQPEKEFLQKEEQNFIPGREGYNPAMAAGYGQPDTPDVPNAQAVSEYENGQGYSDGEAGYRAEERRPDAEAGYSAGQEYTEYTAAETEGCEMDQQYPKTGVGGEAGQIYPQTQGYETDRQYPEAEADYEAGQIYPKTEAYETDRQYLETETGQTYPKTEAGQVYPETEAGQAYPETGAGYEAGQVYPETGAGYEAGQAYPETEAGYEAGQAYPETGAGYETDQQYPETEAEPEYLDTGPEYQADRQNIEEPEFAQEEQKADTDLEKPKKPHITLAARPKFRTQKQLREEQIESEEISEEDLEEAAKAAGFSADASAAGTEGKILTPGQKETFSYFMPIAGMEAQIYDLLARVSRHLQLEKDSLSGNFIVEGISGSGKTLLITNIIKELQKEVKRPNNKIGRIHANALNQKDMNVLTQKVSGGCLIIESAGRISRETAVRLAQCMENDRTGTLYILEDTPQGIQKALERDSSFAARFTEKISIPLFTSDELVEFGRLYANDLNYDIDQMGILALYERISSIQSLEHMMTLAEVKDIIDEAIEKAEKGALKKVFGILTSTRYNEDNYIILREKDFE